MRKRVVCCISGGLLGFALSGTIGETLGLTPTVGAAFSVAAGLALGYVVSTLIDVFTGERTGMNVDHVALTVEDVDLDELAASGRFDIEMGPADLFGARGTGRGLYIRDPAGNRVELRTY